MSKGWMGVLAAGPVSFLILLAITSPSKAVTLATMTWLAIALAAVLVNSKSWMGALAVDAVLIILALLLYYWPKILPTIVLPVPNLDIISMVIALVAVALTILAFGVTRLNVVADQSAS
jgi:hypothetical protein